ncbi:MAG: hypothetical protein U9P10_04880 [Thermodesulfobacteriota bacterium]|nr:hypothetical protein [Thermodesulfobacteriota bacterium]
MTAATGIRPDKPLAFDAALSGSDLEVSGKLINGKSVGPGNFKINATGTADLQAEKLDLATCDILVLENSRIRLSGQVDEINSVDRNIHMVVWVWS